MLSALFLCFYGIFLIMILIYDSDTHPSTASDIEPLATSQCVIDCLSQTIDPFWSARSALDAGGQAWEKIGIHATHVARHQDTDKSQQVLEQIERSVYQGEYQLVFADGKDYPQQLSHLYDPPPLLFVKGNVARLQDAQIAIVGSRKPTPHAQKITFDMAQYLAERG